MVLIILMLIFSSCNIPAQSIISDQGSCQSQIIQEIIIPPQEYYYVRYDPETGHFDEPVMQPQTMGLLDSVCQAIAKAPRWMQSALTTQFHHIDTPELYATLLLNMNVQYVDEIAFTIAYA
ncbi:MAG: hypothetical protein KKG04_05345, partial [Candidatus Thermoplasmatota archaeon]|nr:hypothetical protein [Candidatus Thermoplasmatota archaeon]